MKKSRRDFIRQSAAYGIGFWGLKLFANTSVSARGYSSEIDTFGKLIPDPNRILDLPEGFTYRVLSRTGDIMHDGFRTPGAPDGMAAFPGNDGRVILIRNHELSPHETFKSPFGMQAELFDKIDKSKLYDPGLGQVKAIGGTTTVVFNPQTGEVEQQSLSLAGTAVNCAGGPTPWGSWITCEETSIRAGEVVAKDHGYNFEVPASSRIQLADPIPLKEMGRFDHEAVAVEPNTGIVYQTEDEGDGLIYRFIPNEYGKLQKGGKLQALAIVDQLSCDTRNWEKYTVSPNQVLDTRWIDMDEVLSPNGDLRLRGFAKGAARFARGEGMWYSKGQVYFACTNGGPLKKGQIWRYTPSAFEGTSRENSQPGKLELYIESTDDQLLENCDNLTVAYWGDLIVSEDGTGDEATDENFIRGITPEGKIYTLARSAYHNNSEMCGVCFSPDNKTLFFNIQEPGLTVAVNGPWEKRFAKS
ncbi:PhoX family protein [Puniceicoccaceae bacterium K14]|nr:PhoX family protein [Puniceicoccaceae bacterium K14]